MVKFYRTAFFLLTCFFGAYCLRHGPLPHTSGDVRALMPYSSQEMRALNRMEELFGARLFDSILVDAPESLDEDTRDTYFELSDELSQLEGVFSVLSPAEGYSKFEFPVPLRYPKHHVGRFLIEIDAGLSDSQRHKLNRELDSVVAKFASLHPIRTGVFTLSEAATSAVEKENSIWTPACLVTLCLMALLIFRNLRAFAAVLLPPLSCLIWSVACLLYFEIKLSPVSQLSLPLLLVVGASYSSFVVSRRIDAAAHADKGRLRGLATSLSLAAGTTVAGFVSLMPLDVSGVVQFAVIMASGTTVSAFFAYYLPILLLSDEAFVNQKTDRQLQRFAIDFRPWLGNKTALGIILVGVILALGIPKIRVDTSPYDFLPSGSEAFKTFRRSADLFPGTHALFITFEAKPEREPFGDTDFRTIQTAIEHLNSVSGIERVISASRFMQFDENLFKHGLEPDSSKRYGNSSITRSDKRASRVILETDLEGANLLQAAEQVKRTLADNLPADFQRTTVINVVSRELVMAASSTGLSRGLLFSVICALVLVGSLLAIVFRSWRVTFFGIVPSILPIVTLFGMLGLTLSAVNLGASMVAAVALGMISDNTFHYLIALRAAAARGDSVNAADYAYRLNAGAFVTTALILVLSFSPTCLSAITPVRQFGLFLGSSILLGLMTNAVVLPFMIDRGVFGIKH